MNLQRSVLQYKVFAIILEIGCKDLFKKVYASFNNSCPSARDMKSYMKKIIIRNAEPLNTGHFFRDSFLDSFWVSGI
jgi:hypothetical protein